MISAMTDDTMKELVHTLTVVAGSEEALAKAIWDDAQSFFREEGKLPELFIDDLVKMGGPTMALTALHAANEARRLRWDRDDLRPADALMEARRCLAEPTDDARLSCLRAAVSAGRAVSQLKLLRGTPQQPDNFGALCAAAQACQQAAKTASWALGDEPHVAKQTLWDCLDSCWLALS